MYTHKGPDFNTAGFLQSLGSPIDLHAYFKIFASLQPLLPPPHSHQTVPSVRKHKSPEMLILSTFYHQIKKLTCFARWSRTTLLLPPPLQPVLLVISSPQYMQPLTSSRLSSNRFRPQPNFFEAHPLLIISL